METGIGGVIILCLFFNIPSALPAAIGPFALPVLLSAWAGALCLGMVGSAGLADAYVVRFKLNAERSMLPVRCALAAPMLFLAFEIAAEVSPHIGSPTWFTVPVFLVGLAATVSWLLAAWFARAYMMGTADLLNAVPERRALGPVEVLRMPAPREPRTDAEREARRLREDDSPIPMD